MNDQAETGSLLGRGSGFEGKLTFLGTVHIEGSFEGEISSEETLVVAAGGELRGKVEVGTLIVTGGLVEAEVVASRAVELHPPGELRGTVRTPSFEIEKGAVFAGNCEMSAQEEAEEEQGEDER
jgi:cytoskeletal protein CcmA (bactofilin family)